MKLITILALTLACDAAIATPVKYTHQGKTFAGTVDNIKYEENGATAKFTLSNGRGFKEDAPIDPKLHMLMKPGLHVYSFGAQYVAPGTVLTYVENIWSSTTFKLNHYGIGLDKGVRFFYFDLGDIQK